MKWAIFGVAIGTLFVAFVGMLSVQVIGLQAGLVFGLDNVPVAVTEPHMPAVPMFAIAVLSTLVMYCLTRMFRRHARQSRIALVAGFGISTIVLILIAFAIAPGADTPRGQLPLGVLKGWRGWVQEGGINPAVHVVLFLSIGSLWLYPVTCGITSAREGRRDTEHAGELKVSPSDDGDEIT